MADAPVTLVLDDSDALRVQIEALQAERGGLLEQIDALKAERAGLLEHADLWRGAWESERQELDKLRHANDRLRHESESLRGASITFFTNERAELEDRMAYQERRIGELLAAVQGFAESGDLEAMAPEGEAVDDFFLLAQGINQMLLEIRARMDEVVNTKRFLTELVDSMRDALVVASRSGFIREVNSAMARLSGYRVRELADKTLVDLFGRMPEWLEHGVSLESWLVAKDGRSVPVLASVMLLGSGDGVDPDGEEWALILHDLSDRLELEEKRREAAYRGGMEEINAGVLHNIGNAVGGLIAKGERMTDSLVALDQCARLLEKGQTVTDPTRLHKGLALAVSDLDRIRSEGLQGSVRAMRDGIEHIADIVRAQQSMARGGGLYASLFSLEQAVDDSLALERHTLERLGISVELRLQRGPQELFLPKNPFQQLLLNLLKNARESIGDRIRDGSLGVGEGRIVLTAEMLSDGYFGLELRDNGAGMDAEVQTRIFEYGMTTKAKGSGFGLHSAANFVQSIDGEITLVSDGLNRGATASVVLPVRIFERNA